jgi:hypothetical protein
MFLYINKLLAIILKLSIIKITYINVTWSNSSLGYTWLIIISSIKLRYFYFSDLELNNSISLYIQFLKNSLLLSNRVIRSVYYLIYLDYSRFINFLLIIVVSSYLIDNV